MNSYHPRKQLPEASLRAQSWVNCCSYYILMTCLSVYDGPIPVWCWWYPDLLILLRCQRTCIKLHSDLAHVRNWLIKSQLQMHSSKSKLMFIGSSYNLNRTTRCGKQHRPVSRTNTHKCLGVQIDEKRSCESHIDMICKKANAGIGAMRRIKLLFLIRLKRFIRAWYCLTLNILFPSLGQLRKITERQATKISISCF